MSVPAPPPVALKSIPLVEVPITRFPLTTFTLPSACISSLDVRLPPEGVVLDASGNHKAMITGNTNRSAENNTIFGVSG